MRKRMALLAIGVALAAGGCAATDGPHVATVGGEPTATAPVSSAITEYVEGVRRYVACLRERGIDVTDPDARGNFELVGGPAVKASAAFASASEACAPLLPPLPAELRELPELSPEEIDRARRYAQCMQDNGAPDFPDPLPNGRFPGEDGRPSWNSTSEGALHATRICEPIVGGASTPLPGQG